MLSTFHTLVTLLASIMKLAEACRVRVLETEGRRIGRLEAFAEQVRDINNVVNDLEMVRRRVRDQLHADPGRLRDDDGYRRD